MSIDFGRRVVVLRRGRFSAVLGRRSILVFTALVVAALVLTTLGLTVGTVVLSPLEALSALFGQADARTHLLVVEWRLPRILFAIVCGAALAMSGAVFQSLTRNPLGSPDVIGFDAGSYTGALVVMLVLSSGSYALVATGSLIGGLLTALVVYALAYRKGFRGFRLIIIGIGIGAMLASFNSYLLLRAGREASVQAASWGAGSLASLGFDQLGPTVLGITVLAVALAIIRPGFAQIEQGDDSASALGVRVERTRLVATVLGVGLTAVVTAATGPLTFIALVAPHIARRIARSPGFELPVTAATGAVLLLAADFIAQRMSVATGLVTVSLGGIYFVYLLIREYRTS